MEYLPTFANQLDEDYISHHGIKGMKWGVRRYENYNGTLTSAGKKRYDKNEDSSNPKSKSSSGKVKQIAKKAAKGAAIAGGAALAGYAAYKAGSKIHDNKLKKKARLAANEAIEENPWARNFSKAGKEATKQDLADKTYSSMKRSERVKKQMRDLRREEAIKAHVQDAKTRIRGGTGNAVDKHKKDVREGRYSGVQASTYGDEFITKNVRGYKDLNRYATDPTSYLNEKGRKEYRREQAVDQRERERVARRTREHDEYNARLDREMREHWREVAPDVADYLDEQDRIREQNYTTGRKKK